jgi:hypothetical protein
LHDEHWKHNNAIPARVFLAVAATQSVVASNWAFVAVRVWMGAVVGFTVALISARVIGDFDDRGHHGLGLSSHVPRPFSSRLSLADAIDHRK